AQGWAGATWGAMAIPRVGQELIISYLDGDPDQPIATGRAYRETNLPPYQLPRHKTRMTIKSRSHKGQGFNELRFEDELGQEEVFIHAEKDKNVHIKHNNGVFVGNDRSEKVVRDEQIEIGHDRSERVGNDERVEVGQDQYLQVGRDRFQVLGRDHQIAIAKDRIETIGNNRHDSIAVDHRMDIGGNAEHVIQGFQHITAAQGIEASTTVHQLHASQSLVLQGPGGSITLDANGITLRGVAIYLKGPTELTPPGQGQSFDLAGTAATGEPICVSCWLKAAREGKALMKVDA
ncbi:type VI secretion system Vgr family protein, partial [Pseudomonas sp. 2835]|uniref:type VI secretion system Vgr family protein n=1 Tax=Pseudomonas sp. 2835 TaxID=3156451 RepID=UPI003D22F07F